MSTDLLPPVHPGEILREEFMRPLELSSNEVARRLGITAARVNEVASGRRGITADTALRLSRLFNTSAEFWLNLQMRYELEVARRAVGRHIELTVVAIDAH
jgi:antitoxin HigA-1